MVGVIDARHREEQYGSRQAPTRALTRRTGLGGCGFRADL
jgi:hypothetical protein